MTLYQLKKRRKRRIVAYLELRIKPDFGDCLLNALAFIKIGEIYNFLYFLATDYKNLHRLFLNNHQKSPLKNLLPQVQGDFQQEQELQY
ncbi:MAG: hypothetical protein ACI8P3_002201 [Saprospiraceae bacterium]|jgi:hypothetical protein